VECSCELDIEPSDSIKCWLHNWRLLKKASAPSVSKYVSIVYCSTLHRGVCRIYFHAKAKGISKWEIHRALSVCYGKIQDISTLPSKCNVYFTLICSLTQHVSALTSHHQAYFTLLKNVNCSNIIIKLHFSFLPLTR
jgi:hypothetical protein